MASQNMPKPSSLTKVAIFQKTNDTTINKYNAIISIKKPKRPLEVMMPNLQKY